MILLLAFALAAEPPPADLPVEAPSADLLLYLGEFDDDDDPEALTDAMETEATDDDNDRPPPPR